MFLPTIATNIGGLGSQARGPQASLLNIKMHTLPGHTTMP